MLESAIESEIVRWVEAEGGRALKLKIDGARGFPDRTIFLPDRKIAFAELKRPRRSVRSKQQQDIIAWLQSLGFSAGFCDCLDDVKGLFR